MPRGSLARAAALADAAGAADADATCLASTGASGGRGARGRWWHTAFARRKKGGGSKPRMPDPDLTEAQKQAFMDPKKTEMMGGRDPQPLSEGRESRDERQEDKDLILAAKKGSKKNVMEMERERASQEKLTEPSVDQIAKAEKDEEEIERLREDHEHQVNQKLLDDLEKLKALERKNDKVRDKVHESDIWQYSANVLVKRAREAAILADNAVIEAWRQQQLARDYAHKAMEYEAATLRSLPVAEGDAAAAGRFDYKLTPEQYALYGPLKPMPGTELPVTPLVGGPGSDFVRLQEGLAKSYAPLLPDDLVVFSIAARISAGEALAPAGGGRARRARRASARFL
eukprot:TRINITY_DN53945_c0_g1_i1.p1 TRINITY_DN53945_c0_g1~~TRINITY_DN53945_c0_g1_i1.p1  ORF type:complete len:364 (-),score=98.46 TRINITY_DN53945_c0_g1_i1:84-1112(-)